MKYCYECGRFTTGEPLFCNFCGRSYGVKLCPRLHVNPRVADVCSQCGSRDLSTPQPRVSFLWHLLGFLVRVVSGALLVFLSLVVLVELLKSRAVENGLVVLGLLLVALWVLWSLLPDWFRKLVRRVMKRKEHRDGQ